MNLVKLYDDLINHAVRNNGKPDSINKTKSVYEIHHITPRCLGGIDDSSNLVYMTAKQHYFSHYLLAKIHGNKCSLAFMAMTNSGNYLINDRHHHRAVIMRRIATTNKEKVECIHCKKVTSKAMNKRYHGDNCSIVTGRKSAREKAKEKRLEKYKPYLVKGSVDLYKCKWCNTVGYLPGIAIHHFDNCNVLRNLRMKRIDIEDLLNGVKEYHADNNKKYNRRRFISKVIYRPQTETLDRNCFPHNWGIDRVFALYDMFELLEYILDSSNKTIFTLLEEMYFDKKEKASKRL